MTVVPNRLEGGGGRGIYEERRERGNQRQNNAGFSLPRMTRPPVPIEQIYAGRFPRPKKRKNPKQKRGRKKEER